MQPGRARWLRQLDRQTEIDQRLSEQRTPRPEVAQLLSPRWNGVLLCVVLAGFVLRQAVIVFAAAALLLALGLSWVWGRYCLDRVVYRRRFGSAAVSFGDEVTLTIEVTNRKPLPLPWLEIADEVPAALPLVGGGLQAAWQAGRRILPNLLALRWYERVTRHYRLHCTERGAHVFGPVTLRSGDLFGLASRRLDLPARQTLLVYPKVVPLTNLVLPPRFPLGEARSPNRLHSDPLRVAGIRAYTQGDSLRQVHWKASARLGALQVKTYDPSATLRAMVFLNVDTMPHPWEGIHADRLELLICAAASLASHLTERRAQVGVAANGLLAGLAARVRVPPGRAPQHLGAILSMLARLTPLATFSFADLLRVERHRVPAGATVVIITALLEVKLLQQARAYHAAGHPVSLLLVGEDLKGRQVSGLDVYWLGDEARWRELQSLDPVPARSSRGKEEPWPA